MENVPNDKKSKMGVDHVDNILEKVKAPVVAVQCAEGNIVDPVLLNPAISLLDSVSQSAAVIATVLRPYRSPIKLQSVPGNNGPNSSVQNGPRPPLHKDLSYKKRTQDGAESRAPPCTIRNGVMPKGKYSAQTNHDEITLTLEPVPCHNQEKDGWKRTPYYSKESAKTNLYKNNGLMHTNKLLTSCCHDRVTSASSVLSKIQSQSYSPKSGSSYSNKVSSKPSVLKSNISGDMLVTDTSSSMTESAAKRIQEWHAKHIEDLLRSNTRHSANSKQIPITAGGRAKNSFFFPKIHLSYGEAYRQASISQYVAREKTAAPGQKTECFAVSNRYFRYLNRPKRARHDAFRVIFRAHILIDSEPDKPEPVNNTLYPNAFVKSPSGKIPLPGYKPTNVIRNMQRHMPLKKKKRTVSAYRIAKPKLKFHSLVQRHFPANVHRKPVWVPKKPVTPKRYFPVKWDPNAKKFTLQPEQTATKTLSNRQWFTFPSSSMKNTIGGADALKKFGSSGTILTPRKPNLLSQVQTKVFTSPVKMEENIKEVNVIFNCKTLPDPQWFKSLEDYRNVCILYQVRRAMAARTMKYGYIVGKSNYSCVTVENSASQKSQGQKDATSQENKTEKLLKKEVSNSLVLVSTQTEVMLTLWSKRLPNAKETDKLFDAAVAHSTRGSNEDICMDWLHTCKNGLVEIPNKNHSSPLAISDDRFLEVVKAWYFGTVSDENYLALCTNSCGMARHTGEQPYSMSSRINVRNLPVRKSNRKDARLCNGIVRTGKCKSMKEQIQKPQRSMSQTRLLRKTKCSIEKNSKALPQPSYCVRYRMCFCNSYCTCPARLSFTGRRKVGEVSMRMNKCDNSQSVRDEYTLQDRNCTIPNNLQLDNHIVDGKDTSLYGFSEKSDVPSIVLTPVGRKNSSKWDVRISRSRSKSLIAFASQKSDLFKEIDSMNLERGLVNESNAKFVRTIAGTEIYHKYAVRRFSAPEYKSSRWNLKPTKLCGNTEIMHTKAVKRKMKHESEICEISHDKQYDLTKKIPKCTSIPNNAKHMNVVKSASSSSSMVESSISDKEQAETYPPREICAKQSIHRRLKNWNGCLSSRDVDRHLISKISKEVTQMDSKHCNSAKDEMSNAIATSPPSKTSSSVSTSHCINSKVSPDARRHMHDVIGRDYSKYKHVKAGLDAQSLSTGIASGCKAAEGSGCKVGGRKVMGNSLPKPRLSDVLARFAELSGASTSVIDKVASPYVTNGLASTDSISNMGCKTRSGRKRKVEGESDVGQYGKRVRAEQSDYKQSPGIIVVEESAIMPATPSCGIDHCDIGLTEKQKSIVVTDAEPKKNVMQLRSTSARPLTPEITSSTEVTNVQKIYVERVEEVLPNVEIDDSGDFTTLEYTELHRDAKITLNGEDNVKIRKAKQIPSGQDNELRKYTNVDDASTMKKSEKHIASGDVDVDLPVETRSSRRLRSRVNNKRGRYESDYVSDLPKANKKPKKVLPTRDYDNNHFWRFYRDCEKSEYAKNMALQQKYIKLLKSKGVAAAHTGSGSSKHYSNIICSLSSAPTSNETVAVPDDGLMPFVKRLTKPRKTTPELPKVSDNECAYCGRSFADNQKQIFEDHLARHGMRYTILSAPHIHKKKKMKAARKDTVLKRPKANGGRTAHSVDSPNKEDTSLKSKDPSPQKTSDEIRNLQQFRPAPLSMGHRKQTARKSFSITSTLPKDILIAALECKMRAQSNFPTDKAQPTSSKSIVKQSIEGLPNSTSKSETENQAIAQSYFPKPHTARKTLTGLPITYNHIHSSIMQSMTANKSYR